MENNLESLLSKCMFSQISSKLDSLIHSFSKASTDLKHRKLFQVLFLSYLLKFSFQVKLFLIGCISGYLQNIIIIKISQVGQGHWPACVDGNPMLLYYKNEIIHSLKKILLDQALGQIFYNRDSILGT